MANEIQYSFTTGVRNGTFIRPPNTFTMQITQSVARGTSNTQALTTSEAVIAIGAGVTTLGIATLKNLDSTNSIEWGPESAGAMVSCGIIKPGEAFPVRLKPSTIYRAKAVAGTAVLASEVLND